MANAMAYKMADTVVNTAVDTAVNTAPPAKHRHALQAFGMAALIEAAIVVVAVILLAGSLANKPTISDPVPITLADDPPPEKQDDPKPVPPPPTPQPKLKTPVKPVETRPQTPPEPAAPPVADAPSPVVATPNAFTEPAPAPPAPPVPPSTGKPDLQTSYDAKVRGAVNAWHNANYPVAASTMHFAGKTQVEFHLRDGVVGAVRVLTSCGVGLFDQASLHAVQGASYPETPAELRGHDNLYQIWVEFRN